MTKALIDSSKRIYDTLEFDLLHDVPATPANYHIMVPRNEATVQFTG
jgi:hypothetical protein